MPAAIKQRNRRASGAAVATYAVESRFQDSARNDQHFVDQFRGNSRQLDLRTAVPKRSVLPGPLPRIDVNEAVTARALNEFAEKVRGFIDACFFRTNGKVKRDFCLAFVIRRQQFIPAALHHIRNAAERVENGYAKWDFNLAHLSFLLKL